MPTLPLSCADFTFPLLPHDAVFQLISLLGLDGVDLGLFCGRSHLRPEQIRGRESAAARETKTRLDDLGLKVADVFIQPGVQHHERAANHPDARERAAGRETFRSALEFTAACESRHMTGLPGMPFGGVPAADSLALAAEEASWRVAEARRAGIVYGVEAHLGSIAPTPEQALALIHQGENLSLTLDYGHFVYAGFANENIHPLLDHASHFHARGAANRQLQAVMKENAIDFARVCGAFSALGYPGWVCLEYVWIDWEGCNRADNVSETIILRDLLCSYSSLAAG